MQQELPVGLDPGLVRGLVGHQHPDGLAAPPQQRHHAVPGQLGTLETDEGARGLFVHRTGPSGARRRPHPFADGVVQQDRRALQPQKRRHPPRRDLEEALLGLHAPQVLGELIQGPRPPFGRVAGVSLRL